MAGGECGSGGKSGGAMKYEDDSYNPSSQEYISPERREYLERTTCKKCGLFHSLCKCYKGEQNEKIK